jgi:serine/threonine protein phosphatase PrpC
MGTKELNLAEPISKKIYKSYEDENIRVGICLMQGWRKTMEDTSLAMPNFDGQENSLFGIFDGHGGSIISQFVACNIGNILKNSKYYKKANYEKSLVDSFILLDELLKNKVIDTFLKKIKTHQKNSVDMIGENYGGIINKELLNNNIKNDPFNDYLFFCSSYLDNETNLKYQFPNMENYLQNQSKAGKNNTISDIRKINFENKKRNYSPLKNLQSEVIIKNNIKFDFKNDLDSEKKEIMEAEDINLKSKTYFGKDNLNYIIDKSSTNLISNDIGTTANVLLLKKNYFYVANVGDSLSVMYKKKKAIKLNKEHKTTSETELNRLNKLGTKLINYRINGKLNITRAIGDLSYKNRNNGYIYEQDVLAIPEVNKYSLDDVDFIVMGSDGFWDYGDDIKTICDNIYNELKKKPKRDLCDLIGSIFDKALAKANNYLRGTDNMSCIIIQFLQKR